jgi:hypothetical protein
MEPDQSSTPAEEQIPEPEDIRAMREALLQAGKMIDGGEVDSISVYVHHRNGTYRMLQAGGESRHEDAGRLMEFALMRLGYVDRTDVEAMIERL